MKKLFFPLAFISVLIPLAIFAADSFNLSVFQSKTSGTNTNEGVGFDIASAGDVNNDGYEDVLIGTLYNGARLIYGDSAEIDIANTSINFNGSDFTGNPVASAGDVNNDGYGDMLFGALANSENGLYSGGAYLVFGSNVLSSTIDITSEYSVKYLGENTNDFAGRTVSSAGDVNNDGFDDILVGAPNNADTAMNAGKAYLIYGSDSLTGSNNLADASASFLGESVMDNAGYVISSAGDVNNDNYDDILISAIGEDTNGFASGAVYLVYGSDSVTGEKNLVNADVKFLGVAGSQVGYAVSSAGDVNNDSFDDILIGALSDDTNGIGAGAAYLVYGSADLSGIIDLSSAVDAIFLGSAANDNAGIAVSSAGDLNHDGYNDLLIGASGESTNGSRAGASYVIYGSSDLSGTYNLSDSDIIVLGEDESDYSGSAVEFADTNSDGFSELLIGAWGVNNVGSAYLGYLYIDSDLDGVAGSSGLMAGVDCNDADATVYENQTYYIDSDLDGYGSTSTGEICSSTPTSGYSTNNTDCNDTDNTINEEQIYYQDIDGDTIGNINVTQSACSYTPPTGYVSNSGDCNDNDSTVYELQTYYQDLDGDGLGNPNENTSICSSTSPTGYVLDDTDLDDNDPNNGVEPTITKVEGATNGDILLTYSDNSTYTLDVFSYTTTKETIISQHKDTGYYIALSTNGKKLALVDTVNKTVISTKTLSKKQKYSTNTLKLPTIRNKDAVITVSKKKSKVLFSILTINTDHTKLTKKDQEKTTNKNIKPSKTKIKKNTIYLKNKKGKTQEKYLVTKKLKFKNI